MTIPRNFEARRFGDRHQAQSLARWCGGTVHWSPETDALTFIASADNKARAHLGDWIIRSADGTVRVDPPGSQAGYCADCGMPVWRYESELVNRDGSRWCYGAPGQSRLAMDHWHVLPGMQQYVVPAPEGQPCRCLARDYPHIHQIVPVPARTPLPPGWEDAPADITREG